LFKALI